MPPTVTKPGLPFRHGSVVPAPIVAGHCAVVLKSMISYPFRFDFCHWTVHFRPPATGAPNSTFAKMPFPKHLKPAKQRASPFTSTLAKAPVPKVPPVNVAGWSQAERRESTVPDVKKFASEHAFAGSTLTVPRAKKASWFEPWLEVPSFPLAVNHVW